MATRGMQLARLGLLLSLSSAGLGCATTVSLPMMMGTYGTAETRPPAGASHAEAPPAFLHARAPGVRLASSH
jgi:hypothetical protein